MITVIDNNEPSLNLYEGMNLTEACDTMVLEVHELVNEFCMDTLLTEHAYLYENACEIQYVNEEGEPTKEGTGIKEKLHAMIDGARKWIREAWEKIVSWIGDRVADVTVALRKLGFNEKKLRDALNYAAKNETLSVSPWAPFYKVDGFIGRGIKDGFADRADLENGKFREYVSKEYMRDAENEIGNKNIDAYSNMISNVADIIFSTKNTVKDIRRCEKEMDDTLKEYKKSVKSGNDQATISDVLNNISKALKSNSFVAKDKIMIYQKHLNANLDIAKQALKLYGAHNKDAKAAEKAAKKAAGNEKKEEEKKQPAKEEEEKPAAKKPSRDEIINGVMGISNESAFLFDD